MSLLVHVLLLCFLPAALHAADIYVTLTFDDNDVFCALDDPHPPPPWTCTLREAIMKANIIPGKDTIHLPAGIYQLAIPGADEDDARTGDLDILDETDIVGAGAGVTYIDGNGIDRVMHIEQSSGGPQTPVVKLYDLTIGGGNLPATTPAIGAGILNEGGTLYLYNCIIENNHGPPDAGGGGGVAVAQGGSGAPILQVIDTTIRNNNAGGGGGIHIQYGLLFIYRSTIAENSANGGAAVSCINSFVTVTNSTIAHNTSHETVAFINAGCDTTIESSTFADNPGDADIRAQEQADEVWLRNTIINGSCLGLYFRTEGGNIEGPGNTCGLENPGDYYNLVTPLLPLGDYGGPTPTMPPVLGSYAVDNPWADPNCEPHDQRQVIRPQDADLDGFTHCDSGAVELVYGESSIFYDGFESGDTSEWSASVP